ncbi:hypothetical protein [Streptomyces sp. NBC_01304]|uniref:hypothetical protein n=1 Tax=Streptomyces sp. NBC_01304 TaxID=2903818 RepID=UPI002E1457FA|nr:hypothetical protein OG430_49345 [Streptomyces sp. NBC_01304]
MSEQQPASADDDFDFLRDVVGDDLVVDGVVYNSAEWQHDGEGGVERRTDAATEGLDEDEPEATHILFWQPLWAGAEYGAWSVVTAEEWVTGYDVNTPAFEAPATATVDELDRWVRSQLDGPVTFLRSGTYEDDSTSGPAPMHAMHAPDHNDLTVRDEAGDPQAVWLVTRAEDPGAIPCQDETTARAYAEARYLDDAHAEDAAAAALSWNADDLLDHGQDTGWTISETRIITSADLPNL